MLAEGPLVRRLEKRSSRAGHIPPAGLPCAHYYEVARSPSAGAGAHSPAAMPLEHDRNDCAFLNFGFKIAQVCWSFAACMHVFQLPYFASCSLFSWTIRKWGFQEVQVFTANGLPMCVPTWVLQVESYETAMPLVFLHQISMPLVSLHYSTAQLYWPEVCFPFVCSVIFTPGELGGSSGCGFP